MEPHASSASPMEPIAIVGLAALFPSIAALQRLSLSAAGTFS